LSDVGRDRARQYLAVNTYIGAAPVPLEAYVAEMRTLAAARGYVDCDRLKAGFAHLVVTDGLLEQLGPAVNANKAVFLYGKTGNGKTVLGEGMGRSLGGHMYIPHALTIDGQIVTMYDPVNHEALDGDDGDESQSILAAAVRDRRWVRIRRPV